MKYFKNKFIIDSYYLCKCKLYIFEIFIKEEGKKSLVQYSLGIAKKQSPKKGKKMNISVFVVKIRKLKTINQNPISHKELENLVSLQTTKLVCF